MKLLGFFFHWRRGGDVETGNKVADFYQKKRGKHYTVNFFTIDLPVLGRRCQTLTRNHIPISCPIASHISPSSGSPTWIEIGFQTYTLTYKVFGTKSSKASFSALGS